MHACSLGSTKFSGIWIMDYLWKINFSFHVKVGWNILKFFLSSFTLKYRRIPLWYLQFITGNKYCNSSIIFTGLTVRDQSAPLSLPAAPQSGFITITVNVSRFVHLKTTCGWFDQANANHGWLVIHWALWEDRLRLCKICCCWTGSAAGNSWPVDYCLTTNDVTYYNIIT